MYWYLWRVKLPSQGLRLLFYPRMAGNKWLLREQLVQDKLYEW